MDDKIRKYMENRLEEQTRWIIILVCMLALWINYILLVIYA